MLRRYSRCNQLIHTLYASSSLTSYHIPHKSLFSTSKKSKKVKRDDNEPDALHLHKPSIHPQQEFAELWETTTEDRIEQLTQELRKASGKKMAIFGPMAGYLCAKMGWYQFQFLGMPYEMELVMLWFPFTCLSIHWLSWYFKMNGIYNKLNLQLPPNWKKNEGLIGGTNPDYHTLVVMDDKNNLALLDEWGKEMKKHRILCASMCAVNMTAIMIMAAINPFGDPALAALEPLTVLAYAHYPFVSYAFSAIIYGSPMKNIPSWKEDIVQDLGIEQ